MHLSIVIMWSAQFCSFCIFTIQETRWRGSGCRFFGAEGKKYKLFWMGDKDKI